ncbi:Zinc resistance conferring protein [Mycoemilia scoparia]|uniref:Zinc resistance conferring protein n=1 Tax=Mycoemilia scoparia TaxID=417184 RepID=A0A9W8DNM6_9FUNG|nr:Zinc resistance conferring protein [Mycoemilia scoparia]
MALSRSTRVGIMLGFSGLLFFLELIVGYAAGSIALVADSFHMLNDVLSLVVALYAIKISASKKKVPKNTYGWQRAEVLGALINGVLLLGLCVTIYIEAVQRFISPVPVSNPKLVLSIGSIGLAFNIIGLWLFGDAHGHSHGHSHGHAHSHSADLLHQHGGDEEAAMVGGSERRPLLLSSSSNAKQHSDHSHDHDHDHNQLDQTVVAGGRDDDSVLSSSGSESANNQSVVHPAYTQQAILESAQQQRRSIGEYNNRSTYGSFGGANSVTSNHNHSHSHNHDGHDHGDDGHGHGKPKGGGGHLNMHGVWLHVLGDCLANVAVIASGAFIWLTDYSWRFYVDPIISIIINTIIIMATYPLVKSASFILLQGVPSDINTEKIKSKLLKLPHVLNVHELHVWQLSDTKYVASVHILIDRPNNYLCFHKNGTNTIGDLNNASPTVASSSGEVTKNPSFVDMDCVYMDVAQSVQAVLHGFGIHSTTVQPEFLVRKPIHTVSSSECLNGEDVVTTLTEEYDVTDEGVVAKLRKRHSSGIGLSTKGQKGNSSTYSAKVVNNGNGIQDDDNEDGTHETIEETTVVMPCLLNCRGRENCVEGKCCPSETEQKRPPTLIKSRVSSNHSSGSDKHNHSHS